jgi:hypothetical protein
VVVTVVVQLAVRLITGHSLRGPAVAIGVPVALMFLFLRKSLQRKSD